MSNTGHGFFFSQQVYTGDGFGAGSATICEEFAETFGAVGFFVFGGEPLTGQRFVAVGARETLAVPRFVLVGYTASRDDLQNQHNGQRLNEAIEIGV